MFKPVVTVASSATRVTSPGMKEACYLIINGHLPLGAGSVVNVGVKRLDLVSDH